MYKLVAIAGTFDRLHKGHVSFISQAFNVGEKVIIGLTTDAYLKENTKYKIQNAKLQIKIKKYKERKEELRNLLKEKRRFDRAIIVPIDDIYGSAITNKEIEALVVTEETKEGGEKVNAKRKESGLPPLKLIIIPFVLAQDREKIASTRIRVGEIDRKGSVYGYKLFGISGKLPENIRQQLKKPQGDLIQGDPDHLENIGSELIDKLNKLQSPFIITVGDEVTKLVNSIDAKAKLSIFDFRVNRKEKYHSFSELGIKNEELRIREVVNPPGFITEELIKEIKGSLKEIISGKEERIAIKIEGEDDLAAVPAILLAPLGSVVIYGQPAFVPNGSVLRRGEAGGVVVVEVTEEKKENMMKLLNG